MACPLPREKLSKLTLSNDAIWAREHKRPEIKYALPHRVVASHIYAATMAHAYPIGVARPVAAATAFGCVATSRNSHVFSLCESKLAV